MSKDKQILICGAGPSGLCAAIFLKDKGFNPRIIDKKSVVSPWSKAFAVNARSLTLLEESGITKRFLENGRKLEAMNLYRNGKLFFRNEIHKHNHKYAFLLIQSQRESELILQDECLRRGIEIEFGTQLTRLEKTETGYRSILQNADTISYESDIVIGADGSHSEVREQSGISFPRVGYRGTWELYDVELDTSLPKDDANLFFWNTGGMILIRIKDNLWRVAGSDKDLLNFLPKTTKVGQITWQTKFNIGHHLAERLINGNTVIIGDAAHIHSPFGGRGMNLGIEDAFTVTQAIADNQLSEYSNKRLPYLKKTIGRINGMTTFVTGDSGMTLLMKKCAWLGKPFLPLIKPTLRKFVLGLD